jgi:hypothetical protein
MPECCRTLLILLFCWLSILAPEAVLAAQQAGTSVTVAPVGGMANARDKGRMRMRLAMMAPDRPGYRGGRRVRCCYHSPCFQGLSSGDRIILRGDYPSQNWSWPDHTAVYPAPGIMVLGNNRFQESLPVIRKPVRLA